MKVVPTLCEVRVDLCHRISFFFFVLIVYVLVCSSAFADKNASAVDLIRYERGQESLSLPLYKSGVLQLNQQPKRISVGNPDITDLVILRSQQVHVVGKALGSTNVVFWDKEDRIFASVDIEITHDLDTLKRKLHMLLPGESISVHSAQEKIVLQGQVSNAVKLNAALQLAQGFLPDCAAQSSAEEGADGANSCNSGDVVNLMTVGGSQQVMLEVKVAEMARTFLRTLDTDFNILHFGDSQRFGAVNGGASWPNAITATGAEVPISDGGLLNGSNSVIGPVVNVFQPAVQNIADKGLFYSNLSGNNLIQVALEISRSKGLSKILAEPTLTTLTGTPAEFLSGGEYPIPVPDDGSTQIQYKEFGVGLKFVPTLLDKNRINLDLDISVSEISNANQITLSADGSNQVVVVPSLNKRSASSTVELKDGETIGIAGLIQDNVSEVISKLPGLGDIPLLGALFRSQEFISGQTELVIFVTPHLAKTIDETDVILPTDAFVPPNDMEFYLFGQLEGSLDDKGAKDHNLLSRGGSGGFDGVKFGHQL